MSREGRIVHPGSDEYRDDQLSQIEEDAAETRRLVELIARHLNIETDREVTGP